MKTVKHTATLFYYDGPQVFEARDPIGGHYVALMVKPENGRERYLVVGVEPMRLRQFRSGLLDLRTLLVDRTIEDWYLALAPNDLRESFLIAPASGRLAESDFLPDQGFVLHDLPTEEIALREARERNNLVLEISAEPPEAAEEHRIRAGTLAGLLGHIQTVAKHAYNSAKRELSLAIRRQIDMSDAHLLDVVIPASAGSFRVILEAAQKPDLIGQTELGRAFQLVDVLFENAANPQKVLATVKENRGHLAGAYLRLLRFLAQHKTGLRYSWAEPGFARANYRSVSEAEVGPLVEILSSVSNLGSESLTLVGSLEKVNRGPGTWGLLTGEGLFSGEVKDGGPSLDGLKVGGRYKFSCIEEIQEMESTGREVRKLYLTEHEPE